METGSCIKERDRNRWLGPGKIVFQNNHIIFVTDGGVFVRVSPNCLILLGSELPTKDDSRESRQACDDTNEELKVLTTLDNQKIVDH